MTCDISLFSSVCLRGWRNVAIFAEKNDSMKKIGILLMALMCWVPSVMAQHFFIYPIPQVKTVTVDVRRTPEGVAAQSSLLPVLRTETLTETSMGLMYLSRGDMFQWYVVLMSKAPLDESSRMTVKFADGEKMKLEPDGGILNLSACGKTGGFYYMYTAVSEQQLNKLTKTKISAVRMGMNEAPINRNEAGRWLAKSRKMMVKMISK